MLLGQGQYLFGVRRPGAALALIGRAIENKAAPGRRPPKLHFSSNCSNFFKQRARVGPMLPSDVPKAAAISAYDGGSGW
jgi:hypothetical protein